MPAHNFCFIKSLSRTEGLDFFLQGFEDWDHSSIRLLMQYKKFMDLLNNLSRQSAPKTAHSFVGVFQLEESTGNLQTYSSMDDLKFKRFVNSSGEVLKGAIERDGTHGKIELRPFAISVKALDSDFEFRQAYIINQWEEIIAYLQRKSAENPSDPKQLVDKVCEQFQS